MYFSSKKFIFSLLSIIILSLFYSCNQYISTKNSKIITIKRSNYTLDYYSNWSIDSTDTEFNIDSYFTLNSASNNGSINFFIFDTLIDAKSQLDAQISAHLNKIIANGIVTKNNKWGIYDGEGAMINGKLGGIKGEVRIFVFSSKDISFLIVYQIFDDDKKIDLPGLELIEKSFKVN